MTQPRLPLRVVALIHLLGLVVAICLPALAWATDGVIELNQTCATHTGCTPADAPGYPITIDGSAGRSYRLTSDLMIEDPNLDGILLQGSHISLDFNGFMLVGTATGNGTGRGVADLGANGPSADHATLRDGTILGVGQRAIDLVGAEGVRIEKMRIVSNAGGGLELGDGAHVIESRFKDNGGLEEAGVEVGTRSIVRECTSDVSEGDGFVLGAFSLADRNVITSSGGNGLTTGFGSTARGNVVSGSAGIGIVVDAQSLVIGNTVTASFGGVGISLNGTDSGYADNVISVVPLAVTGGTNLGGNLCNGLACP